MLVYNKIGWVLRYLRGTWHHLQFVSKKLQTCTVDTSLDLSMALHALLKTHNTLAGQDCSP